MFLAYVLEVLVPELNEGDVVILDNPSPHKAAGVREATEAAGATPLYLPPYSPDFNPIENMWSNVNRYLRSAAARAYETLQEAITLALLQRHRRRLPRLLPELRLPRCR